MSQTLAPIGERMNALLKQFVYFCAGLFVLNLVLVNFIEPSFLLLSDVAILLVLTAVYFLDELFFVMVFMYPFIGWQFTYGSINIPVIDLLGTAVFAAWLVRLLSRYYQEKFTWNSLPGIGFAILLLVSAILSLTNAPFMGSSVKYIFRPLVFFYLVYLVLPYNLITNKRMLDKIYKLLFGIGIIVAVMGLLSIFFTAGPWYTKRAIPFVLFGVDFLGGNQNAIAEVLIVTIPISLILFVKAKDGRRQGIVMVGVMMMIGVLLLTFSRAGWLALLLQIAMLFVFRFRKYLKLKVVVPLFILFLVLPGILYFMVWQDVPWVQSSNWNRLLMTEIAVTHFLDHPLVGNGVNTFQYLVSQTFVYTIEFGDPLESHGFIQKTLVEQGVLGLIAFVGLLFIVMKQYVLAFIAERNRREKFILLALLLMATGTIFFQLFSTSYYLSRLWMPLAIGLAASREYLKK